MICTCIASSQLMVVHFQVRLVTSWIIGLVLGGFTVALYFKMGKLAFELFEGNRKLKRECYFVLSFYLLFRYLSVCFFLSCTSVL